MQIVALFLGMMGLVVIVSFVLSLPVMLLWDAVVPAIFNLPEITWLQAWGLSLLCGLLFKSHISNSK
jgi:hypothetical protein